MLFFRALRHHYLSNLHAGGPRRQSRSQRPCSHGGRHRAGAPPHSCPVEDAWLLFPLFLSPLTCRCSPSICHYWGPFFPGARRHRMSGWEESSPTTCRPLLPTTLLHGLLALSAEPVLPTALPASIWGLRLTPSAGLCAFPSASWASQPGHHPGIPNSANPGMNLYPSPHASHPIIAALSVFGIPGLNPPCHPCTPCWRYLLAGPPWGFSTASRASILLPPSCCRCH